MHRQRRIGHRVARAQAWQRPHRSRRWSTRDVAAGACKRCHQSLSNHVFGHADERHGPGYGLKCSQGGCRTRDNRIGRGVDQSRRPLGQIIVGCLEAAWNDNEVFSLDKTTVPQFIEERLDLWCLPCGGEQEAEPVGAACFLRARRERPYGRAADKRDELAPFHSITSSARAESIGAISMPSALAVLRLMTNSNLVVCTAGRSVVFAPLRTRPV